MPSRYIRHSHNPPLQDELSGVKADILSSLNKYLAKLGERSREQSRSDEAGVYVGSSGLALMRMLIPESAMQPVDSMVKSQLKSHSLHSPSTGSRVSFLETSVGPATLIILLNLQGTTSSTVKSAFIQSTEVLYAAIMAATSDPTDKEDDEGCEVLYGRAGLLYALLKLRAATEKTELDEPLSNILSDKALSAVISSIVERGRCGSALYSRKCPTTTKPGLMWRWHGKRYFGAAHGIVGILHILLKAPWHLIEHYWDDIFSTTVFILELQDETGNWPSKAPTDAKDSYNNELVQWCHGATGVVIFLSAFRASYYKRLDPDMRRKLDMALTDGARLVYRHGFLRKGLGLCHGVAGSVFALLAASDATADNKHLERAVHLAHLATVHAPELIGAPDRPWSLYEGVAGMCCAWSAILHKLGEDHGNKSMGMPGFDDI